jgi:hypothetical protein
MSARLLRILVLALASVSARAAPVEREVEPGLVYFRVHELPADLPEDGSAPTGKGSAIPPGSALPRARIVDVRYASGDPAAAALLLGWLRSHAGPKSPVFLLANPETSAALLAPLNSPDAVPNLVILGPVAPNFEPDIAMKVSGSLERRAYDAFEKGATLDSLIHVTVEKERDDEEHLEKDRLKDRPSAADTDAETAKPAKDSATPPLIDTILQRAVQLHQALLALRRL